MRTYEIPEDALCYRTLGPWTQSEIPAGLQKQHRLKAGSWGKLTVLEGTIEFWWDDVVDANPITLRKGQSMVIPPTVPHHLQIIAAVKIELSFHKHILNAEI